MSAKNDTTELAGLFGPAPICAALSAILPAGLLVYIIVTTSSSGITLLAVVAFLLFLHSALAARSDALTIASVLVGLMLTASDVGLVTMAAAGGILFIAFVLHGLSLSLRRSPAVSPAFVRGIVYSTLAVIALGWVASAAAISVANLTLWPALVVPAALISIGLFVSLTLQQLVQNSDLEKGKTTNPS